MLSQAEKAVWVRTLLIETRIDDNAVAAQSHLVALMDQCAQPDTDWCGCPSHTESLETVTAMLWRSKPQ